MRLGNFRFSNPNSIHIKEQISVRYTKQYLFSGGVIKRIQPILESKYIHILQSSTLSFHRCKAQFVSKFWTPIPGFQFFKLGPHKYSRLTSRRASSLKTRSASTFSVPLSILRMKYEAILLNNTWSIFHSFFMLVC